MKQKYNCLKCYWVIPCQLTWRLTVTVSDFVYIFFQQSSGDVMNTHNILAPKSLSFLRYDPLNNLARPFFHPLYWVGEFCAISEAYIYLKIRKRYSPGNWHLWWLAPKLSESIVKSGIQHLLLMLHVLKNLHLYWYEWLFVIFAPPPPPCAHMKCQFALILYMGNV